MMKETRIAKLIAETRSDGSQELVLTGLPIVFDQETVINSIFGEYKEVIQRGALDGADLSDVRLLYNHDMNKVPLARTPKTMELAITPAGVEMRATLPDTSDGHSVYTAVQRGDLSGMSFAFKVPKGGDSFDANTNTRTISKIEKLYECSIVPFPAYPQTSVEARSVIEGERLRKIQKEQAQIKINQIMKRGI